MERKTLWIFLFVSVSVVCGQSGRRGTFNADERRNPAETNVYDTSGNQWNSDRPNQQSSGFNQRENEFNRGQNQQHSSSNRESEYNQRPNQQSSSDRDRDTPNQRPFGSFSQVDNNREADHSSNRPNAETSNHRPNQQLSGNRDTPNQGLSSGHTSNRETEYNERPNQRPFGSFGQVSNNRETDHGSNRPNGQSSPNQRPNQQLSNNRENEYNQRPNQQGNLGQFGNGDRPGGNRPNSQSLSNQRPNQQGNLNQFGNGNNRPNAQSSSNPSNNREGQAPNQQGNFGEFGSDRPGGNQYAQRPATMGSLQPEGSQPLCYGFFGCFSQSEPWTSKLRPVPAPLPPENNSATFYFYSRPTIEQRYLINVYPEFSLGEAKFDRRRPTVIIIHGFIQDGNELWMEEMKNAYLRHTDANAIIVDWGKGSRRLSYLQAAGNTRLIGSMISYLIKRLMEGHGADPSSFHLIGHSLGAHVASYAAKEVPGIGRLTALDPAQPGFEGFDKSVRLDKSDAQFVDVVHTNAKPFIPTLGLGMIKPHGHVDFYMNGGYDQPLCVSPPSTALNDIKSILDLANLPINWFSQTFFCDHARAYSYLTEAFNNTDCVFWGHKASIKSVAQGVANTLTQGLLAKYVALSSTCSTDDCVPLGFETHKTRLRGSYVVTTKGQFPYCIAEKGVSPQRGNTRTTTNQKI